MSVIENEAGIGQSTNWNNLYKQGKKCFFLRRLVQTNLYCLFEKAGNGKRSARCLNNSDIKKSLGLATNIGGSKVKK